LIQIQIEEKIVRKINSEISSVGSIALKYSNGRLYLSCWKFRIWSVFVYRSMQSLLCRHPNRGREMTVIAVKFLYHTNYLNFWYRNWS